MQQQYTQFQANVIPEAPKFGRDVITTLAVALVVATIAYGAMLSVEEPIGIMALVFGIAYIGLAWKLPHMALATGLALAPMQNDVSGGVGPFKLSLGELSVFLCFIVYIIRWFTKTCEMKWGPFLAPMLVYLAVCLSSSLINWSSEAQTAYLQMLIYFIVAPVTYANLVKRVELLNIAYYLLIGMCMFLSIAGLASGTFYIFGLHKNGVGSSLAVGVIVATELFLVTKKRSHKAIMGCCLALITGGLVFTLSRGAWISAIVGYFIVIGTRGKMKSILQATLVLVPLIAAFWLMLPEDKKTYATDFDSKSRNISARYETIDTASRLFSQNPIFGVGIGLRKEIDATNVFWITLAETGVQGLISLFMVHFVCLAMIFKTQRFVSRDDPRFSLLVLGGALLWAKIMHGIVDHYWSRGPLLIAWAGAGMATRIYYHEQQRLKALNIEIMKFRRKKLLKSRAVTVELLDPPI